MKWLAFAATLALPVAALLACHPPRQEKAARLPRLIVGAAPSPQAAE
jgi:hypothetical protein